MDKNFDTNDNKLRLFFIKEGFTMLHAFTRSWSFALICQIVHFLQLISFTFGPLSQLSEGYKSQSEITILMQKVCIYSRIFTIGEGLAPNSVEMIDIISLSVSFILNMLLILLVALSFVSSVYQYNKLWVLLSYPITLYHYLFTHILILPTLEITLLEIISHNEIGLKILAALNLVLLIGFRGISLRMSRSYCFKTKDYLARRSSLLITVTALVECFLVLFYVLVHQGTLGRDVNTWLHLIFSVILMIENFQEFSFLIFKICKLNGAFSVTYFGVCLMNLIIYYLDAGGLKSFDLSFSFMISLPLFILASNRVSLFTLKRIITSDFENEKNFHRLDLGIRILLLDIRTNKNAKNAGVFYQTLLWQHFMNCAQENCFCQKLEKEEIDLQSYAGRKKWIKKYFLHLLERMVRSQRTVPIFYFYIYVNFLLQQTKIPTKSFYEVLKLREKFSDLSLPEKIFTELFVQHAMRNFQRLILQNSLQNQSYEYLKVGDFEKKTEELRGKLLGLMWNYVEFYTFLSQNFIDLNVMEKMTRKLLQDRLEVAAYFRELYSVNPKSIMIHEVAECFFNFVDTHHVKSWEQEFGNSKEFQNLQDLNIFSKDCCTVAITLMRRKGLIKKFSRNFPKIMGFEEIEVMNQNINLIVPRAIAAVHDDILDNFIENASFRILKSDDRTVWARGKSGYIFPVQIRLKLEMIAFDDFAAVAYLYRLDSKSDFILVNSDGFMQETSEYVYKRVISNFLGEFDDNAIKKINAAFLLPSLMFSMFLDYDFKSGDAFDTILIAPKSNQAGFFKTLGRGLLDDLTSLRSSFYSSASMTIFDKSPTANDRQPTEKSQDKLSFDGVKAVILDKLKKLKALKPKFFKLYLVKVKIDHFVIPSRGIDIYSIEFISIQGLGHNKKNIFVEYLSQLISFLSSQKEYLLKVSTNFLTGNSMKLLKSVQGQGSSDGDASDVDSLDDLDEDDRHRQDLLLENSGFKQRDHSMEASGLLEEPIINSQRISEVENVLQHEVAKYYKLGPHKEEDGNAASFVQNKVTIKQEDHLSVNHALEKRVSIAKDDMKIILPDMEASKQLKAAHKEADPKMSNSKRPDYGDTIKTKNKMDKMKSEVLTEDNAERQSNSKPKRKDRNLFEAMHRDNSSKVSSNASTGSNTKGFIKNFLWLIQSRKIPASLKIINLIGLGSFIILIASFTICFVQIRSNLQKLRDEATTVLFAHNYLMPNSYLMKEVEKQLLLVNYFPPDFPNKYSAIYSSILRDEQRINDTIKFYNDINKEILSDAFDNNFQKANYNKRFMINYRSSSNEPQKFEMKFIMFLIEPYVQYTGVFSKDVEALNNQKLNEYYFLFNNFQQYVDVLFEMGNANIDEELEYLEQVTQLSTTFLVLNEIVIFLVSLIIFPIFVQVTKQKEEYYVLFCTFQQDSLKAKVSLYIKLHNGIAKMMKAHNKMMSMEGAMQMFKKQSKKLSISQHSKLQMNTMQLFVLLILSFGLISIYPLVNSITLFASMENFRLNINEITVLASAFSSTPTLYALNYYKINKRFYKQKDDLTLDETLLDNLLDKTKDRQLEIIKFLSQDLERYLIQNSMLSSYHRNLLDSLKNSELCSLLKLPDSSFTECQQIFKGKLNFGLLVTFQTVLNEFENLREITRQTNWNKSDVEDWMKNSDTLANLDRVYIFIAPLLKMLLDSSVTNFLEFIDQQSTTNMILYIYGILSLILLVGVGFYKLLAYLKRILFDAISLLSVLPADLMKENPYLYSFLTKQFKSLKI